MTPKKMFVPSTRSELLDLLASILLSAPKCIDRTGRLAFRNLEYVFRQLSEGLSANRANLGEQVYGELTRMAEQVHAHYEADPDDTTGDTTKAAKIIWEMEDLLRGVRPKS